MATTVAKLATVSTLDSTGFTRGLKTMQVGLSSFQSISLGAFARIGTAITGGITRALSAIPKFVTGGLAIGDALMDSSRQTGIAADKLTTYYRAAKLAGVGTGEFDMIIHRLNVNVADAIKGDAKFAAILGKAGVDLGKIADLSPDETFLALADAISKTASAYDRAFVAQSAFGRGGFRLLPLLSGGRAGISNLASSTRALGAAPSTMDIAKMEKANDAIADLGTALTGLKLQLAKDFAEPLTKFATNLLKWLEEKQAVQKVAGGISAAATSLVAPFTRREHSDKTSIDFSLNPFGVMERINDPDAPWVQPGYIPSPASLREYQRKSRIQRMKAGGRWGPRGLKLEPSPALLRRQQDMMLFGTGVGAPRPRAPSNAAQPEWARGEGEGNPFTRGPGGGLLPNRGWTGKPIASMSKAEIDYYMLRMKGGAPAMRYEDKVNAARFPVREQEVKDQKLIDAVKDQTEMLDRWLKKPGGGMKP